MTLTFVSNYINHHQIPLSDCLYEQLGDGYRFIQTEPMAEERKAMGWGNGQESIPYLIRSYEEPELTERLIAESDIVIFGGCEDEELIKPRLLSEKPTIRYSERIYKEGQWKFVSPKGLKKKYQDHIRFRKAPVYLLCAGGYVASDFHLIHAYPDKMLRFGYFPVCRHYENEDCHERRQTGAAPVILWAGRFLEWKHPELPVRLMKDLRQEGIACQLRMIGGGELETELKQTVEKEGLSDYVRFCGFMEPPQVREQMERADIFLFTSDYREGWGAVLNESMNSGCAVVANQGIGAVPYLIREGVNGLTYKNGDYETLKRHVKLLLEDQGRRREMGKRAYETIRDEWNPQEAADRLLDLCGQIVKRTGSEGAQEGAKQNESQRKRNGKAPAPAVSRLRLHQSGPCSPAPILSPGIRN